MEEYAVIFNQYLNYKGLKLAKPRRCILGYRICACDTHFNAEEQAINSVGKDQFNILATVYRTILSY